MDKILINDLLVQIHIGVGDAERKKKQNIYLSVTMFTDLACCSDNDSITNTISYSEASQMLSAWSEETKFRTLEAFAHFLIQKLFATYKLLQGVTVRVTKTRALTTGLSAAVEITRWRQGVELPQIPTQQAPPQPRPTPPTTTTTTASSGPASAGTATGADLPIVTLSRREHFSASHFMHSPHFSQEENAKLYGKCNNPNGHGHNYEVEAVLRGPVNPTTGMVASLQDVKTWMKTVVESLDHKNLNLEVDQWKDGKEVVTAENILVFFWDKMQQVMGESASLLHCVRLWETPRNMVEYFGCRTPRL
eukprot:TRINITY_DN51493_c0_g1_i1.p1 TRINITY_DN51493_c0_g1~~TRINITY_DN51493_c0_g1_i1.p1  ORF type:complete len:306 (+),score=16.89 TRINITY_DN51493_c0_g1_i1:52-969(+)